MKLPSNTSQDKIKQKKRPLITSGFFFIKNDELREAFQDGCDKIVGKLTALGYEPNDPKGPDEICDKIQEMYNKRYSEGYTNSQSGNAKIEYIYHSHSSACGAVNCHVSVSWETPDLMALEMID